jgi:hypothetical protein
MRKAFAGGLVLCFVLMTTATGQSPARNEVRIIEEADLYCSLLAVEEVPRLKIKSAERMEERAFLHAGDLFVFDRFPGDGVAVGQMMTILDIGKTVKPTASGARPLTVAYQKGRAKIVMLDANSGRGRIEKECGEIQIGQALGPFVQREVLKGRDLGFASIERKPEEPAGSIFYLAYDAIHIGPGQMALVDIGTEKGIQAGRQLTVFRQNEKNAVWQGLANVVVIHAGPQVSVVKVLSARDSVLPGDIVQAK